MVQHPHPFFSFKHQAFWAIVCVAFMNMLVYVLIEPIKAHGLGSLRSIILGLFVYQMMALPYRFWGLARSTHLAASALFGGVAPVPRWQIIVLFESFVALAYVQAVVVAAPICGIRVPLSELEAYGGPGLVIFCGAYMLDRQIAKRKRSLDNACIGHPPH